MMRKLQLETQLEQMRAEQEVDNQKCSDIVSKLHTTIENQESTIKELNENIDSSKKNLIEVEERLDAEREAGEKGRGGEKK